MGTPRSAEATGWLARAFVFSGRPDPEWEPPGPVVTDLERLFGELPPHGGEAPEPPPLGYRGVALTEPGGRRYEAYGGVVTLRTAAGADQRADPKRRFEDALIGSAPPGTVPAGALRG
jgi:hypothetical protein